MSYRVGIDVGGTFTDLTVFDTETGLIVPLRYDADGSGRVSDTSAAAVSSLRDAILGTFPVSSVDVGVRAPLAWGGTIDRAGAGWSAAFDALGSVRAIDGVPDDTYLVGFVDPAATLAAYCGSGCVSSFTGPGLATDVSSRRALMIGFATASSAKLDAPILHPEGPQPSAAGVLARSALGSAMGRQHAPCGNPGNPDVKFPYKDGKSPAPGWNIVSKRFIPAHYADLMSYCAPQWVTDYTFAGLAKRIAVVNGH